MQTAFSPEALRDPDTAHTEGIVRKCVHCGFCTATCPTYVTLGNELDSPRGRIYLVKEMLENDRPADEKTVTHIDRCLSCLACMTTCPSGVNYMHLVDHARAHIEKTYRRPLPDRLIRLMLAKVLPYPKRFRLALKATRLGRPLAGGVRRDQAAEAAGRHAALAPASLPAAPARPNPQPTSGRRVAILAGCAQSVLDPGINAATVRLLAASASRSSRRRARAAAARWSTTWARGGGARLRPAHVDVWTREIEGRGLEAIVVTASGCGTTIKDYGHMLRLDPAYAEKAARVSALAKDVTEYLAGLDLPLPAQPVEAVVAYHSACSMQHGQKITSAPRCCWRRRASPCATCRKGICAAARPAPTTSCSPRSRPSCATARSPTSKA